ncbi:hypothetical protein CASFOL_032040 [Castilleja foliolosa]|uniref:Uncharacterized protein n=1 Tax=Castilleja foliolosa TaxID=1961234 RepID=A0ABD3C1A1_9LAMI
MRSSGVWFWRWLASDQRGREWLLTLRQRELKKTATMNKEDWLLDWEIMSTHWCKGTTSLCCPHLDERNGSTVCLLMELPYSSKVGKQLQPVFEYDKGLFSPQALSPVGTSLGSSRKVVLH